MGPEGTAVEEGRRLEVASLARFTTVGVVNRAESAGP